MKLGVLKEQGINRVAFIPKAAKKLKALNLELYFESGAGAKSSIPDRQYVEAGFEQKDREWLLANSDIIVTVKPLAKEELQKLKSQAIYISMLKPYENSQASQDVKTMDIKAFSMDMIPRSTLAQSVDILSSMASLAGYRAVLLAAKHLPKIFPMMMTAAGTIRPAKVLILGAGVAGLQAIATARRLGAVVEVFDVRPAVKEEVESLGAKFVEVEGAQQKDEGGYAVEQTEEYKQKQAALIQERAIKSDIIITTAQLRGKPAPLLIQKDSLDKMNEGSVVVDLASSSGGNCAMTEDQKTIYYNGICIIGNSNLADEMPHVSSELFSNNMTNYLKFLIKEDGSLDLENEITSNSLIN